MLSRIFILLSVPIATLAGAPAAPEILEIKFGQKTTAAKLPAWFVDYRQEGGTLLPEDGGWQVDAGQPFGTGRLDIELDRARLKGDVALTTLYTEEEADLAVQLFDADNQVLVVDLFANVIQVSKAARTDTVIVPLSRYPSATRIVLRRLSGALTIQGVVLFPVIKPVASDRATLKELAAILGDPLSPDNPLLQGVARVGDLDGVAFNAGAGRDAAKVIQAGEGERITLRITGMIDGSEEIHIAPHQAEWVHKHWAWPSQVTVNGVSWNPRAGRVLKNRDKTRFLESVDFSTARVLLAKGRDVAAMVPTAEKLIVYLSDSPNGAAAYELVISLEAR